MARVKTFLYELSKFKYEDSKLIMGVDQSTTSTGCAIFELVNSTYHLRTIHLITHPGDNILERINTMSDKIIQIYKEYDIKNRGRVAIEYPVIITKKTKGQIPLKGLIPLIGLHYILLDRLELLLKESVSVNNGSWKQAVTGRSRIKKLAVHQLMLGRSKYRKELKIILEQDGIKSDFLDAIGIGVFLAGEEHKLCVY